MVISSPHRVWIENGILFHQYQGEITLEHILENEKKSLFIIEESGIEVVPMIVLFKEMENMKFDLGIADCGKVIEAFNLPEKISSIWIVDTENQIQQFIDFINKIFHINRVHVVHELQEAQVGAHSFLSSTGSILERE